MATTYKISELDELTAPAADDDVEIRDVSDNAVVASGKSKRIKWLIMISKMFASRFAADAGSTDTYVVTLDPVPLAYVTGEHYRFKANTANTGACTVNFNSLGAKTIKKAAGGITTDLADNDIRAGQWVDLVYDGTNMQMQSLLGNAPAGGSGGIGDVVGPGSSVDSEVALFNSTTGKLIKRASTTGILKGTSGVLSAATAGTDYVVPTATMNDQTGTTYTLQASDNGKVVTFSNASAITVTVPSGLGAGFNCMVVQKGAGQVTFSPSSSTINNRQSHTKIAGQYGVVSLVAYAADVFALGGDTAS